MDKRLDLSSHKVVVRSSPKIIGFSQLGLVHHWHKNKKIAHCHGVFDVLHLGHIDYLYSAKAFGDVLVVTLTEDKFVNKGVGRPYFSHPVRARMIAALEMVDYVAINPYAVAVPAIEALKPHFYVKGPDYKGKTIDPTRGIFAEKNAVESHGGQLVFTDDPTHSSSEIINQVLKEFTVEQRALITHIKELGGIGFLENILKDLTEALDDNSSVSNQTTTLEFQFDQHHFTLTVLGKIFSDPFSKERLAPQRSLQKEKTILSRSLFDKGCPPAIIPFLANLFEDLSQVNEKVNARRMLKALESILK